MLLYLPCSRPTGVLVLALSRPASFFGQSFEFVFCAAKLRRQAYLDRIRQEAAAARLQAEQDEAAARLQAEKAAALAAELQAEQGKNQVFFQKVLWHFKLCKVI